MFYLEEQKGASFILFFEKITKITFQLITHPSIFYSFLRYIILNNDTCAYSKKKKKHFFLFNKMTYMYQVYINHLYQQIIS